MSDIRTYRKLRAQGARLGRAGLSQRVIHLVKEFDGSYKGAMVLAGRLQAIAHAAGFDAYWSEKVNHGYHEETFDLTKFAPLPEEAA